MYTWPTIHAERRALAADLQTVTGDQWDTPSLCRDWTLLTGSKRRISGLTLHAIDAEWSHGTGPEVAGPVLSLVMAMTGRTAALDDLTGAGVATLRARS
jgi:hypothetical protein